MRIMFVPFSVSAYFPPLVKAFRSNIIKLLLAGLIWSGIGLYLIRPVKAKANSGAFTSWLETVVKKGGTDLLQEQIYQLKESDNSLNTLIQKASEIVSRHNEDFNLPLDTEGSDTGQVYNLLLMEWNSYQTGNGMAKASTPGTVKTGLNPNIDKIAYSLGGKSEGKTGESTPITSEKSNINHAEPAYAIKPLVGGMAINAP